MIITIIISITILLIVIVVCYTHYKLYNYKTVTNEINDIKWDLKTIKDDIVYYKLLLDKMYNKLLEIETILKLRK